MRTWLGSITCLRKPAKLPGPALPVSTAVVTPEVRQNSSASMPIEGAAPINVGMQIDKARGDDVTRYVAHVGSRVEFELVPDHGHPAGGERDIRHGVELLGGVNHPTAAQDQIERHCNLPT